MNGSSTDTLRAFIAARPNPAAQSELIRVQRELKKALDSSGLRIKWTDPETFHITLLFLGDIPAVEADPVFQTLEKICDRTPSMGTSLSGLGLFKKSGALWVGIDALPELMTLQRQMAAALEMETGRFHAHCTLCRIKKGRPDSHVFQILENTAVQPVPFEISELELIQSELLLGGARHTVLGSMSLCCH